MYETIGGTMTSKNARKTFVNAGYERWRTTRIHEGYTSHQSKQSAFARMMGVSPTTYSRIANGDRPSMLNAERMAS